MKFILDTNAFVDHLRNGADSKITQRLLNSEPNTIFLCSLVLAELLFGAIKSGRANSEANLKTIHLLESHFPCLPFDEKCAHHYAKIRFDLQNNGKMIGPNDLIIAATVLGHEATLVTHNVTEFQRIPTLPLEDWQ